MSGTDSTKKGDLKGLYKKPDIFPNLLFCMSESVVLPVDIISTSDLLS